MWQPGFRFPVGTVYKPSFTSCTRDSLRVRLSLMPKILLKQSNQFCSSLGTFLWIVSVLYFHWRTKGVDAGIDQTVYNSMSQLCLLFELWVCVSLITASQITRNSEITHLTHVNNDTARPMFTQCVYVELQIKSTNTISYFRQEMTTIFNTSLHNMDWIWHL